MASGARSALTGDAAQEGPDSAARCQRWLQFAFLTLRRIKWDLERASVRGGRGSPADGVQKGLEAPRVIETGRVGQGHALEHARAGLKLPDDLEFLAQAIVFEERETW